MSLTLPITVGQEGDIQILAKSAELIENFLCHVLVPGHDQGLRPAVFPL
jgi:hypothetical protein